jgi:quercetin dioxygenase-like cupin family protein
MVQFAAMKRARSLFLLIAMVAAFAAAPEVELTSEPSHHLALENEYLRVFKVEVAPHAATLMHRHRHDYVFVTLGDSHISNEVEGKAPVDARLADGDTRFAPGNFAHIARNLANAPFRNVTIEIMQDEKMRAAASSWPEESGEKTFAGGRNKILFANGGVRVSEVDLDAGATVPSHHHNGPHLMVAVSDLDLRSDVEGMGPMPGKLKAGDIKWLPGGYTHTLTNTGDHAARFVTVEFP